MNGPQHYAEAERLLGLLAIGSDDPRDPICAAAAQAHATLALAAATISAADVVHYTDDGSKRTSPMDLPCNGGPNWDEVTR